MLGRPGVFAAVLGDCGEQDTFREVLTKRYPQLRSTQSLTSGREPRMPKLNHLRLAAYTTTRPIPTSSPPPAHAPSTSPVRYPSMRKGGLWVKAISPHRRPK